MKGGNTMKRERKLMTLGAVIMSAALTGCVPFVDGGVEDYYYSPADDFTSPYYGSPWYQPAPSVFYPGNNPWYSPGYFPPSFNRPGNNVPPPPPGVNRPQAPSNNRPVTPPVSGQRPGAVQTAPSGGTQSSGSGNTGGNRGGATGRH